MRIATTGALEAGPRAPIVYRGRYEEIFPMMAEDGYQAVELHIRDSREINREDLKEQLRRNHLTLTSIGTGAAYGAWHLNIGDRDPEIRRKAIQCLREHMITASPHHALIIIGSMQGRFRDGGSEEEFVDHVEESLYILDRLAEEYDVTVGYEIMNHYESDFLFRIEDGVRFMEAHSYKRIGLHIDTVHMNIDEKDLGNAIRKAGAWIRHVHVADNDRYYPGHGHMNFREILQGLKDIDYQGALALETFYKPESRICGRKSLEYLNFIFEEVYGKNKKFISIGQKIIFEVTLFMFLFAGVFSVYVYSSMQKNAMNRYEQQIILNTKVSVRNIDHYISSMITATRSVYINHSLMDFLRAHHEEKDLEGNEARITEYFKSVYYASTVATQIYLVMPYENFSILYEPKQLKFSVDGIDKNIKIPEMENYSQVYVEPTHVKTDYGHKIPVMERYPADEQVITVWLPISNLPANPKPIAYMAIDLPISFITDNCSVIDTEEETVYVIDENNMIIASSNAEAQMKNLLEYYPWYRKADQDSIFSRYKDQVLAETRIDSRYFNWSIVKAASIRNVYSLTTAQMVSILVLFGVLATLFLLMTSAGILKYVKSLRQITLYMEKERESRSWDQERKISDYISYHENDEIGSMIDSFQRMMDSLKEHAIQKYELKLAYTRAELRTMQAQINPHFIYNVIQCFATNALKDKNRKQYQMISSFGQMLHYAMVLEPSMVSADKEIEYIRRYIALQQMRFEKQLTMIYEIHPASADFKIPKMSVQPLIENSMIHGDLMRKDGGIIKLKTELRENHFYLLIQDNGVPVSEKTIGQIQNKIHQIREKLLYQNSSAERKQAEALEYSVREDENHNHFIGIENVFSRLLLSFGYCDFRIYANHMEGTSVEFEVPLKAKPFQEVKE